MMSVVIGQALDSGRTEDGNQLQPKRGRVNLPEMIAKCEQVRSGGDRTCCAALRCCSLLCWHAVPQYLAVQLYFAAVQYCVRCTAPHILYHCCTAGRCCALMHPATYLMVLYCRTLLHSATLQCTAYAALRCTAVLCSCAALYRTSNA